MNTELTRARRFDWAIVGLGLIITVLALVANWPIAVSVLIVAGLPILGFLVAGHVSGRGVVVGSLILILGATLLRTGGSSGNVRAGDLVVLAGLAATALAAGGMAERMASTNAPMRSRGERWISIVVETESPPDVGERLVRPKVAPRCDPERRNLARLFNPRQRQARRVVPRQTKSRTSIPDI